MFWPWKKKLFFKGWNWKQIENWSIGTNYVKFEQNRTNRKKLWGPKIWPKMLRIWCRTFSEYLKILKLFDLKFWFFFENLKKMYRNFFCTNQHKNAQNHVAYVDFVQKFFHTFLTNIQIYCDKGLCWIQI